MTKKQQTKLDRKMEKLNINGNRNCYTCRHRSGLVYVSNSRCLNPKARVKKMKGTESECFDYPVNFDPALLAECDGYETNKT